MAKTSPTQRALADMKEMGWTCQVVEKWNPHARVRVDLFGCIDIVAMGWVDVMSQMGYEGSVMAITGIQVTSASGHSARRAKVLAEPRIRQWLECGARFEIWSYGKKGKAGKRKLWTLRREEITLSDFRSDPA